MERIVNVPDPPAERFESYCERARQRIGDARSLEEALAIEDELCKGFARECSSSLVLLAARAYVRSLVERKEKDQ
jgi:hypothetical protein